MSSKTQFTVLTDRSHGGSSLKDGSLELMVRLYVTITMCVVTFYALLCTYLCMLVLVILWDFSRLHSRNILREEDWQIIL